ncbi:MAG: hypothetical protein CM15mP78_11520 [Candidatus Poseidoniales archaeon]|nr:MAG: hypothetical protein CM15mP78_11520 [Candidatus Poseidoniales archaeon]
MTKALCVKSGADTAVYDGALKAWTPTPPATIVIPPDASMLAFACLSAKVCSADVEVEALPTLDDTIGHEVLTEHLESFGLVMSDGVLSSKSDGAAVALDLRHANDLITPVAALLALASGGSVSGAEHAAYKETDRTVGTVAPVGTIRVEGNLSRRCAERSGRSNPQTPSGMVETYGDHRMQMTALVLAMGCKESVLIKGATLHEVADPGAIQRWRAVGVYGRNSSSRTMEVARLSGDFS